MTLPSALRSSSPARRSGTPAARFGPYSHAADRQVAAAGGAGPVITEMWTQEQTGSITDQGVVHEEIEKQEKVD